jgi:hypothetical protein
MTWLKAAFRAIALAALTCWAVGAAWFSSGGMALLFPAAGAPIVFMAVVIRIAKFVIAVWLVSHWREISWLLRPLLIWFVLGLVLLDGVALYSQLVVGAPVHNVEIAAATVAPIRYLAELFGADGEAARKLIAARVTCFDICAVVVTATFAAQRRRTA